MSEVELAKKVGVAIDAILSGRSPEIADPSLAEFVAVATELRDLPRPDFKLRLRNELEREVLMSTAAKTKQRQEQAKAETTRSKAGKELVTVTPYLIVSDVHQEIDFIKTVFGAKGKIYGLGSQGGYHSEYRVGDSVLMIGGGGEGSKWKGTPVPASLHVYVHDVDGVYQQALQSGANSLMPPTDMDYGERGAAIEDVGGNHWYVATAFGPSYVPEGLPNVMPFFNPRGAKKMIEFLQTAFAAETLAVYDSPDGTVHHARVRIGDSMVEMGEAHGQWQPRPMHFFVNVEDCDAAYARAMNAEGAISVSAPANAPYGGRTGTIQDPFGNTWYLNSAKTKERRPKKNLKG